MKGREFLTTAQHLIQRSQEADWRTAAGRAYYGLLMEARAALLRWGFALPRRDQLHAAVRLRFLYAADPDLKTIGYALEDLSNLRNQSDYQLEQSGRFNNSARASQAVQEARDAIALLDQIEADPIRRAAAIAAIQAVP
jgi:uncharacterized protein (UPF0332 family)